MAEEQPKYVRGSEASKRLGVHARTLYLWEQKGMIDTIRTPGGMRMYNVDKYLQQKECMNAAKPEDCIQVLEEAAKSQDRLNIVYARVSSQGQKDDLERQKQVLINLFPKHLLIEDIGSGINLNKRGIRKIIELAIDGKVNEVVVTFKDRLTRFGFELIEDIVKKYSKGKIVVLNSKDITPEEELAHDVLQIMNVYVAKMNGLRKYVKKKKTEDNVVEV